MPPEAVKENPVHTVKIDSFSFGVLVVQILTRQFPKPGDRLKTVHTTDLRFPTIQIPATEIERRQNHISQVDPNHPLQLIALDCLKDEEMDRPSAQELCTRIAALKECPQYSESVRIAEERTTSDQDGKEEQTREQLQQNKSIETKEREIQQLRQQHFQQFQGLQQLLGLQNNRLQDIEKTILDKKREIGQLRHELDNTISEKNRVVKDKREKDAQIQEKDSHIQTSEQVMSRLQTRIQELETHLSRRDHPNKSPSDSAEVVAKQQQTPNNPTQTHGSGASVRVEYKETIKLSWRKAKEVQCRTFRSTDAVVSDNIVYLRQSGTEHIHAYNSTEGTWSQLSVCLTQYCTLAVVNNLLTTIGGKQGDSHTNLLFSLTT